MGIFRAFQVLATLTLALALAGCGVPWTVVSQASPSPMKATSRFTVQKMTFENLQVGEKSDAKYASEKEAETAQAWQGDKEEMAAAFATALSEEAEHVSLGDGGDFVVQVNCGFIEPGYYAYVASAPAEIKVRVKIVDRQGNLVDEIAITTSAGDMAKRTRLRNAARRAGAATAEYLKKRLAP